MEPYRIRENFNPHKPFFHKKENLLDAQKSILERHFDFNPEIKKKFATQNEGEYCLLVKRYFEAGTKISRFHFETSYFTGAQWLVGNSLPIIIEPKFNKSKDDSENVEIDYIRMMVDSLQPSENINHLSDLVTIDFKSERIPIRQKEDLLSPLLVIQFVHLLHKIIKKGLKNSYYKKTTNLHSRVRGKILVSQTVKHNHSKHQFLKTVCSYDEFGVDHLENRLLKKAFQFATNYLEVLRHTGSDFRSMDQIIRLISPAFNKVSDEVNILAIKNFQPNPMFKEYGNALKLAKTILKRFGFNLNQTAKENVDTPPFLIDMSKLFELYVLSILRKRFPTDKELLYY